MRPFTCPPRTFRPIFADVLPHINIGTRPVFTGNTPMPPVKFDNEIGQSQCSNVLNKIPSSSSVQGEQTSKAKVHYVWEYSS